MKSKLWILKRRGGYVVSYDPIGMELLSTDVWASYLAARSFTKSL